MAGRGPAPKPASERRRRNKPPEERVLAGTPSEVLPLPKSYRLTHRERDDEGRWVTVTQTIQYLAETREWYEAWTTSPLAVEWSVVDRHRFRDLARLQDQYLRGDLSHAAEIRLQLAAFGGTPADRRRLGVRLERPEEKPERPVAPVRRLRAVDHHAS